MPEESDQTSKPETSSPSGFINQMTGVVGEQADTLVPSDVRQKLKVPFTKRLWIILAYLFVGTLLAWRQGLGIFGWWIGGIFGFFLIDIDHLLDVFFLHPDKDENIKVKQALQKRNWAQVWQLLISTAPQRTHLILHSIIFESIIAVLAIYVATSSGGLFPKAVVLSFWLRILSEQVREYMDTGKMNSWFWQIKDPVPSNLQAVFLTTGLIVWIFISLGTLT